MVSKIKKISIYFGAIGAIVILPALIVYVAAAINLQLFDTKIYDKYIPVDGIEDIKYSSMYEHNVQMVGFSHKVKYRSEKMVKWYNRIFKNEGWACTEILTDIGPVNQDTCSSVWSIDDGSIFGKRTEYLYSGWQNRNKRLRASLVIFYDDRIKDSGDDYTKINELYLDKELVLQSGLWIIQIYSKL